MRLYNMQRKPLAEAQWVAQPKWERPAYDGTYEAMTLKKGGRTSREGWSGRAGAGLIAYGTPASRVPSVVYCRWLEDSCMPK